jgi:hypothetical protein
MVWGQNDEQTQQYRDYAHDPALFLREEEEEEEEEDLFYQLQQT